MENVLEPVIEKIKKLLRLASNEAATPGEAAAAAAAAARLQMEYKVSVLCVEEETSAPAEHIGENVVDETKSKVAWKGSLLASIARALGCRMFWRPRGELVKMMLVGRDSDVDAVRALYEHIVPQIDRITAREARGAGRVFANNFRFGMVETIGQRLEEMKRESEAAVASTAIVLVRKSEAAVSDWMKRNLHLSAGRRAYVRQDFSARSAGAAAGRHVSLTPNALRSGTRQLAVAR